MEAATGVNGTVDGLEVDRLNFQEIESPSEQTKSYIVLESPTPATLPATNWSEHISCLISPGCNSSLVVGESGNFDSVSHLGFEALYTNPAPPKDHGGDMVTELTLGNYRSPNCINGEELLQLRKGLQEDSKEMLNRPRYLLADGSNKIANQVDTADFLPSQTGAQRPPLSSQFEQCYSLDVVNIDYPEPPIAKRKAIEFRGGDDKKFQAYTNKNGQSVRAVQASPFAFQRFAAKDDRASPLAAGDKNLLGIHRKRISVRNFLKPQSKLNEVEKLQMFKLIVNHVNYLHSQGFILKHLRPSHFVILPSKQVRYIGPLVQDGQIGLSACKTDLADCMENASKRRRILVEGRNSAETSSTKHKKVFEHFMFSSLTVVLKGQVGKELDTQISRVKSSICEVCDKLQMDGANKPQNPTVIVGSPSGGNNSIPELLKLEERWYVSPEELNEGICSSSSNIYSLGVLLFELFCHFESQEAHFAAMLNLRHRILPPRLLSEHPREASICLWMLHPHASSRPKIRDILQCDVLREDRRVSSIEHLSASINNELSEAELLLHFLIALKEQKEMQTSKLMEDLGCIDIDLEEIKRRHFSREHVAKETILQGNSADMSGSYTSKESQSMNLRSAFFTVYSDGRTTTMKNFEQLENAYFSMRSKSEQQGISSAVRNDIDVLKPPHQFCTVENNGGIACMQDESSTRRGSFFEGLCKYACNKTFKVRGSLRNMDVLNAASVICSLSFDQNENYFAAAGASKKIKVFEFDALLNSTADIHYPVVEMPSKSKLSCVCWNGYIRNYLASTDYDGVVQLWDASTGQGFHQYSEHQKRAWSVDFSPEAPTKLASGSDDCSVKLWNIHEKNSINTIKSIANVCCVQFSSHSPHLLGFGSADYRIYCFDIRNTRVPWCTLAGHRKTVSYIKFVDSDTIVSASTDNTLKLWDLKKTTAAGLSTNACSLTMTGHTNEKNFVGLSVCDGYVLCGSETNEVYAYHKNFPMPITSYKFGYIDPVTGHEIADDHGLFVSSVCWRRTSNMVLAANSNGSIKLLQMV